MQPRTIAVAALAGSLALGTLAGTAEAAQVRVASPAPVHMVAAAKQRSVVSLRLSTQATTVAKKVAATVKVRPAGKRTVKIQTRSKTNTWETVAKARTDSSGKAKTTFITYKSGNHKVRAIATDTKRWRSATSASKRLKSTYPAFGDPPTEKLNPLVPGSLSVAKKAATSATVGEFTVTMKRSGKPALKVTDGAGRTAWASAPGKAFVTATRSKVRWIQRSTAGAFWAQVDRKSRLRDQKVNSVTASAGRVVVKGRLSGDGKKAAYSLTLTPVTRSAEVSALQMDVTFREKKSDVTPNSVQLTSGRSTGAAIHGFGNQYQGFDLSGQVLPILVEEQGVTRGEQPAAGAVDTATWAAGNLKTTYGAWPTYVTGQNRSFEVTDTLGGGAFGIADMTRDKQVSLESFNSTMTARVLTRNTPKELLKARAAGTTRPALAGWVQDGAVLGLQGGTDKVRQVVADMQAAGTKISGVWLQDWVGKRVTGFGEQLWWTWQLDTATYPGWDQMVADFKAQGIDVLTYVNPFVIDQDEVNGVPIRNFYKEAEQKGYLVKNQVGDTYVVETVGFPTALVDLTNPDARDWFAGVIADQVLRVGATGFMADFGEYLPFDSVLDTGKALKQHNRWPQLWAKTVREACKQGGVPDCVAFFRSSYLGTAKNAPLMWAGDQMVDYAVQDGMRNAVQGMLAGGVSGAPLWHSDIGGYTSINAGVKNFLRPPELNARWAQMQAFGVVMRTHETNRPPLNQQVYDTTETRAQFARASRIYAALQAYRTRVIEEAVRDGIPAMRHGWLVYPGTKAAEQDLQFFLGDHLLVAPVYEDGATTVKVTFPPGTWKHILTGEVFSGDSEATVSAPLDTPAAFVKVGDPVGDQIVAAMQSAGL
jgi:alpha-glucosidase